MRSRHKRKLLPENLEEIPLGCFLCHFIKNLVRIKISRWVRWLISLCLLFYLPYLELDIMDGLFYKRKHTETISLEIEHSTNENINNNEIPLKNGIDPKAFHLEPNDGTMRTTTKFNHHNRMNKFKNAVTTNITMYEDVKQIGMRELQPVKEAIKVLFTADLFSQAEPLLAIMLNKHPDIFYVHEPLFLTQNRKDNKTTWVTNKILGDYFGNHCHLPRTADYLTEVMVQDNHIQAKVYSSCVEYGICFRYDSDNLLEPPICDENLLTALHENKDGNITELSQLDKLCPDFPIRLDAAEKHCETFKVKSAFSSYVNLQKIPELVKKDPLFRLLIVVQDPRALIGNHKKAFTVNATEEEQHKFAYKICADYKSLYFTAKLFNDSPEFPGKIKLIRYEDLIVNTETVLGDIYVDFLGIESDDTAVSYVKSSVKLMQQENSTNINNWINHLDWKGCQNIQKMCGSSFKDLGFVTIDSEEKFDFAKTHVSGKMAGFEFFKRKFDTQVGSNQVKKRSTVKDKIKKIKYK